MKHYEPKDFGHLIGLEGLTDELLRNHFELYKGYVKNTNAIMDEIAELTRGGKQASPAFAELKRRFGWEWNGVRLHELYFENLSKSPEPLAPENPFSDLVKTNFKSLEAWTAELEAAGNMRGIGWVVTYHDPAIGNLFNVWIDQHDTGHLATGVPAVVLDVFEHAYMLDYGVKKADYLKTFLGHLDWAKVGQRLGLVVPAPAVEAAPRRTTSSRKPPTSRRMRSGR